MSEQDSLDRFRQRLLTARKERIERLAQQDSFEVKDRNGNVHTFFYRPLTVGEYRELEELTAGILHAVAEGKNKMKDEPARLAETTVEYKRLVTEKSIGYAAKAAEFWLGIKEDDFYKFEYKAMVEIINACKLREDDGAFL